jgi:hypothetical protein
MHTALVSRILRDKTMWEEVSVSDQDQAEQETRRSSEAAAGSLQ